MPVPSEAGNHILLLVVDRATRFPFAVPLLSKEAIDVARNLLQLCLTFGVPLSIRSDEGSEFIAALVQHLCRWLRPTIDYGPADHPRGQGAAKRLGAWFHDVPAETYRA